MNPAELEEFELHLLECESCRAGVRLGAVTRVALVESSNARNVRGRIRHIRPWWLAAAAAVLIAVILARRDDDHAQLGDITPAPFVSGPLRPAGDSITAQVDSGMIAYAAAEFRSAARQLERASATDSSASVAFFLGVSLLMVDENRAALRALERANIAPYATEAALYRAKAYVRLGHPDSAIAVLDSATSTVASEQLVAFADSIRRR
jgi:hypothetical protein